MLPMGPPQSLLRHWVIGDVHGCDQALLELVNRLPRGDRLVLLGDVINRGPRVEASMDIAWGLVRSGRAVWLMGNHEWRLVRDLGRSDAGARRNLERCLAYRQLGDQRCRQWGVRLAQLPFLYRGDGWVATHAGFDPHTWEPHLTIRMPFWQAYDGRFGDVVVGHTPGPGVRRLGRIVLIDTGACYGGQLTAYCPQTGQVVSVEGLPSAMLPPSTPLVGQRAPGVGAR